MLKPIKDFVGRYSVSDKGEVFSHPVGNNCNRNGKWLTKHVDEKGYENVTLCVGYKRYSQKVHRLVAQAFLAGHGQQVNHIDGDKTNNSVSNLEWCSNRDNTIHAYKTGLRQLKHSKEEVMELLSYGNSQHQVAKILGIDQSTVSRITTGKTRRYAP